MSVVASGGSRAIFEASNLILYYRRQIGLESTEYSTDDLILDGLYGGHDSRIR